MSIKSKTLLTAPISRRKLLRGIGMGAGAAALAACGAAAAPVATNAPAATAPVVVKNPGSTVEVVYWGFSGGVNEKTDGELVAKFNDSQKDVKVLVQVQGNYADTANKLTSALERLQTRFDQDVDDFLVKAHDCVQRNNDIHLAQLATTMMHNHVELFEKEYRRLFNIEEKSSHPMQEPEEVLFFA